MGRIRKNIDIDGHNCWTLFDSGARNTYIVKDIAVNLPMFTLKQRQLVSLGGRSHNVINDCRLECMIDSFYILAHARVLEEIGVDEHGKRIEVLIGALTMQEWGIRLNMEEEKLDMSHYPNEFIEF
ncbi:hypothetical protein IH992_09610 [Candidatus Poribacteria bacterium]|nr:hypothetical protein [Candidatus Poribacteria bacterium]